MHMSDSAVGRLFARPLPTVGVALVAAVTLVALTFVVGAAAAAVIAPYRAMPLDISAAVLVAVQLGLLSLVSVSVPVLSYWAAVSWLVVPTERVAGAAAIGRVLGAVPRLLVAGALVLGAGVALAVASLLLAPLWVLSPVAWGVVALRRRRRGARRGWRSLDRWAVAITPLAPLIYWMVAWAQWVPRIAVQGASPRAALRGSAADVRPRWGEVARIVLPWVVAATAVVGAVQVLALLGEWWGWADSALSVLAAISIPVFLVVTAAPVAAAAGTWTDRGARPPRPRRILGLRPGGIRLAALTLVPLLSAGIITIPQPVYADSGGPVEVELMYVSATKMSDRYEFAAAIRVPAPSTVNYLGTVRFVLNPEGPAPEVVEAYASPSGFHPWTIAIARWQRAIPEVGTHTITAQFLGDENFAATGVVSEQFEVRPPAQRVYVSWDPPGSVIAGQAVPVRAVVTGSEGRAPTGLLSLTGVLEGTSNITTVAGFELVPVSEATAVADVDLNVLPVGTHNLAVYYEGDEGSVAESTLFQFVIVRDPASVLATETRLSIGGQTGSIEHSYGEDASLFAEVVSGDGVRLTEVDGTVTFFEGADEIATVPVTDGYAIVDVRPGTLGSRAYRAVFAPSAVDVLASTSDDLTVIVRRGVAAHVRVPELVNGAETFAVTIELSQSSGPDAEAPAPSGWIEIVELGGGGAETILRTVSLVGGVARTTFPAEHLGERALVWRFAGDTHYVAAQGRVALVVHNTTTVATLELATPHIVYGDKLTLSARVEATDSPLTPSGRVRVELRDGTPGGVTLLAEGDLTDGEVDFQVPVPAPGAYTVVAEYQPEAGHSPASSSPLSLVVPAAETEVEIEPVATEYGTAFELVARARIPGTGEPAPGRITFRDSDGDALPGGSDIEVDDLGVARLSVEGTRFRPGTTAVRAEYLGTDQWAPSQSTVSVDVQRARPVVEWSPRARIGYGEVPVSEISLSAGSALPADGTIVSFVATDSNNWVVRARAELVAGTGVVEWDGLLRPEEWTVTVTTEGDDEFEALAETFTTSVAAVATRVELTELSATSVPYGGSITVTAVVSSTNWTEAPTGRVVFRYSGVELGAVDLVAGGGGSSTAVLTAPLLGALGARDIAAIYEPDTSRFAESWATSTPVTIVPAAPVVTLELSPAELGDYLEATARVALPGLDEPFPTGTLTFSTSGANGGRSYVAGLVNGVAVLPDIIRITEAGEMTVSAAFRSTDSRWRDVSVGEPAATATVRATIAKAHPAVTVTAPSELEFGRTLSVTVQVAGPAEPRGEVQLLDAETRLPVGPSVALAAGAAVVELDATEQANRLGERRYVARFAGDANHVVADSSEFVIRIDPAATTIGAYARGNAVNGIFVTETGEYAALVQSSSGAFPSGEVTWLRGDDVIGRAPVGVGGVATIDMTPSEVWSGTLQVFFTPADPERMNGASTAMGVVWRDAPVTMSVQHAPVTTIERPVTVMVSLYGNYTGPGIQPVSGFAGTVEVVASTGESCTAEVPGTRPRSAQVWCDLVFSTPGHRSLAVSFSGGGPYAAATGSSTVSIGRGISTMEVTFATADELVGLGTATVAWRLVGPAVLTEESIVIRAGTREVCRSSELSGTCRYELDARSPQASISGNFLGDSLWAPTSAGESRPVVPCYDVPLVGVVQPELGSLTRVTGFNCGREGEPASGVRRGTAVEYRIEPRPGYEAVSFGGYMHGSPGSTSASLVISTGHEWGHIGFAAACVPVVLTNAVLLSGECRTRAGGPGIRHGGYVWIEAWDSESTTPTQFVGWSARTGAMNPRAERQYVQMHATGERFVLTADFAPACYTVTVQEARDVELGLSGTECTIYSSGASGYEYGTPLTIESTGMFGHSPLPPTVSLSSGGNVPVVPVSSTPITRVDQAEVTGALTVTSDSTRCVPLDVVTEGEQYGSITLLDTGNCVLGEGWYTPGSRVEYRTSQVDNRMSSHAVTGTLSLSSGDLGTNGLRRFVNVGSQGGTLTARFASTACVRFEIDVKPAGAAQFRFSSNRESNGCLPGHYDATGGATFTIDAVTLPTFTDAKVGITGYSYLQRGGEVPQLERTIGGASPATRLVVSKSTPGLVTATVWVCQKLDVSTRITDPWGGVHTESATQRGLVAVSQGTDCPLLGGSYQLGRQVMLMNAADPQGFRFGSWSGPSARAEAVQSVIMDGVTPKRLLASYTAICYVLKTRLDEADPGVWGTCPGGGGLWHAGGTFVPLVATGKSGTFQGWFAPDPRDIYAQDGVYALVHMTEDREVYANYRGSTWRDSVTGFFEDVGNVMAMFAKQALGGAAQAFKYVAQEVPPFSYAKKAVLGIGLVGEGVASLLEFAGVDAGWLDDFRSVIGGIDEVWNLAWAPLDCVTVWSVGGNGGAAAAQKSWAAHVVGQVDMARKAQRVAQISAAGGPNGTKDYLALAGAAYTLYGQSGSDTYRTLAQRILSTGASTPAAVIALMDHVGVYYESPQQAEEIAKSILTGMSSGAISDSLAAGNVMALASLAHDAVTATKEYQSVKMLVDIANGDASWAQAGALMSMYVGTGTELAQLERVYGVGEAFVSAMVNADWTQPASETFSTSAFADSFSSCMYDTMPGFFGMPR